jgi:hypothetical protein
MTRECQGVVVGNDCEARRYVDVAHIVLIDQALTIVGLSPLWSNFRTIRLILSTSPLPRSATL